MSSRLRFGFAAFMLVAAFSTPAASNPFTDLFSSNSGTAAPPAAPAAAPAQDDCLSQPGRSTAPGQHWVYRYDGHRKCWFQAEASTALARKPVHRHVARQRASEEDEFAPRRRKAVEDARDEMLSSAPAETPQPAAPSAQTPQPTPPTQGSDPTPPEIKLVKVVPVRIAGAAAMVPPPPAVAKPGTDQLAPDQPTPPRQVDVEKLLADAPAASDEVASATPVATPGAETGGGGGGTANWLGALLMVLGGIALLSSSRTLRRTLWRVAP